MAPKIAPPANYTGPKTALQKHVSEFDPDNTGLVTNKTTTTQGARAPARPDLCLTALLRAQGRMSADTPNPTAAP